ncbi:uncharacterized protein LODBEIA_P28210 [Lodderomyces beijingensis]|uniref:Mitochondrial genome maintenance protein MGM101 n=1 Tax=Lodderomyces beijingensis TaxID=1775926 RepID=A0ABP0ZQV3_9ASCO
MINSLRLRLTRLPLRPLGPPSSSSSSSAAASRLYPVRTYAMKYTRSNGSTKTAAAAAAKRNGSPSPLPPPSSAEPVEEEQNKSNLQSSSTAPFASLGDTPPENAQIAHQFSGGAPAGSAPINWSDSYHGLGARPFEREIIEVLLAPITETDIEIKPDGILYLPEIKYRRILNRAFGPGGWGLVPRTESTITKTQVSREYGLICHGRLVSIARGEMDYYGTAEKVPTALEGCKSNALMRCCKDLGIASELWDPAFIRVWKKDYAEEVFCEHVVKKTKQKLWKLKASPKFAYPWKQI